MLLFLIREILLFVYHNRVDVNVFFKSFYRIQRLASTGVEYCIIYWHKTLQFFLLLIKIIHGYLLCQIILCIFICLLTNYFQRTYQRWSTPRESFGIVFVLYFHQSSTNNHFSKQFSSQLRRQYSNNTNPTSNCVILG